MKKVKYVKFHQGLFIPGPGNIGDTLPSQSKSLTLSMYATPEGISLDIAYKGNSAICVVPWPNVVVAVLEPEPTKPAVSAAKAA